MESWWNTQNPDDVYYIATFDWSVNGVNMPFATEVYGYYSDFGNGSVPFFGVIGAYNILMYGDNYYQPAQNMVPDAIESFNHMGVSSPIADRENNFWGYEYIDVSGVFATPSGNPIDISITNNSNPNVATALIYNNIITLNIGHESGSTEITVTGDDGSDETANDIFKVTAQNPNLSNNVFMYNLEDSPTQTVYPNNNNPYSNSYLDLGWTTLDVFETEEIANVHFSVVCESVDYASEGSFRATSPSGTDVLLYESTSTTPTQLELDVNDFNGETMDGEWIVYMVDSYGDGGHQITDGIVSFIVGSPDIGTVNGTVTDEFGLPLPEAVISVSNISTLSDASGQFSFDIISGNYTFTCEKEGFDDLSINDMVVTNETAYLDFQMALVAGPVDLTISYNHSMNQIELNWTYHTPVDHFKVYRSTDPTDFSNAEVFITYTENHYEEVSRDMYFYRVTAEYNSENRD